MYVEANDPRFWVVEKGEGAAVLHIAAPVAGVPLTTKEVPSG